MSGVTHETVNADEDGLRLDRWFKRRYPDLPYSRFQKITRAGHVRVNGKRAKAGDRLETGQIIRVPPIRSAEEAMSAPPTPRHTPEISPEDRAMIQAAIIYEDDDALVINKPAGLASQGGTGTPRHVDGLLTAMAGDDQRPRLVHRLDRDTSGVLALGKTAAAASKLTKAFRDRTARKIYWALVAGVPNPDHGTIDLPLKKAGGRGMERMVWEDGDGDRAVTDFAVLERAGRAAALVVLKPLTGRTHQIRAHLAAIGHPVLGDGKYGGSDASLPGMKLPKGMMLHARSLDLPAIRGRSRLHFEAEPPAAFAEALASFGFDPKRFPDPFSAAGR